MIEMNNARHTKGLCFDTNKSGGLWMIKFTVNLNGFSVSKWTATNRNVRILNSMFTSVLGWGSFCTNYGISAACHRSSRAVVLLKCNGNPGCLDRSLWVICIVGVISVIFLLEISVDSLWGFWLGLTIKQSDTIVTGPVNAIGSVTWYQSCWKRK